MNKCLYCNQDYTKPGGCNCTVPVTSNEQLHSVVQSRIRNIEIQLPFAAQQKAVLMEDEIGKLKTRLEN